jgi:hypothetical protein
VSYNPYVSDADDPATVLALLDAGADPRARYCLLPSPSPDACDAHPGLATYKFWATPAMLAIQNNLYKVAELLLKAEAQQKSS